MIFILVAHLVFSKAKYLKCINFCAVLIFAVQFTAKLHTARNMIPGEKAKKFSNIFR